MTKQLWLIVAGALTLTACAGLPSSSECENDEKGSNQYNPCSPIDEPAQAPTPAVGDPKER